MIQTLLHIVNRTVGVSPLLTNEKRWVLAAASLAASVGSSLFGASKAAEAAKKAKAEQTYRSNAEKAWYDKNYNTDYLDTKAGQNLMRRAQQVQDEYVRKADGAAAVGGGTAAATAQAKEAANRTMGDTIANIAAQDSARKDQVSDQHQANLMQQSQERQATEQARAQNITTAARNASDAFMIAAGSLESTAKSQSTNNLGSSENSGVNTNVHTSIPNAEKTDVLSKVTGAVSNLPVSEPTLKGYAAKSQQATDEAMRHRLNRGLYG